MISLLETPSLPAAVAAEQTYLEIPSQPEWIAPTVEYLKNRAILCGACDAGRANKLVLALHEALTNAVIHGNLELSSDLKELSDGAFAEALAERAGDPHYAARPVEIRIDYDGRRCRWIITDQGKGFAVERALARAEEADPEALLSSGRGILLMRAFLDDLRYELEGRRAILTMERPSGEEKRRTPRLSIQQPVHVAPIRPDGVVDWDAAYEAVSQNVSSEGMALLQSSLAGSERILIGFAWQGRMLYLPAEVRHCQAHSGDVIELGCRFQVSPSSDSNGALSAQAEEEIAALLDHLDEASLPGDERRKHPRAPYHARVTLEMETDGSVAIGFARDLSRGGMSLLTSTPLPLDQAVLTLPQHPGKSLRLRARIVRCHQLTSGIYDVGVRFLDVAAAQTLNRSKAGE